MIKDKKVKKQFDEIGKDCYGFDSELELIMYRYLCRYSSHNFGIEFNDSAESLYRF